MKSLRTFMWPVYYRLPSVGVPGPIHLHPVTKADGEPIYWLDEMLNGGLAIPDRTWSRDDASFLMLLAGAPGTGKSTFALELCYNLARKLQPGDREAWCSLYVSGESSTTRILDNARSFGWSMDHIIGWEQPPPKQASALCQNCFVLGTDNALMESCSDPGLFFKELASQWQGFAAARQRPDVLVIDSLNVLLQPGNRGEVVKALVDQVSGNHLFRPRLLMVIINSAPSDEEANYWEYLADGAIRFDGALGAEDYYQRSFQIVKIKTQAHAWGRHALKVLSGARDQKTGLARPSDLPYLKTGGSYVFPSIHWHLSRSIREYAPQPSSPRKPYATPFPGINSILGRQPDEQGWPAEHTTALVGTRGSMKSHLAYYFMLSHAWGLLDSRPKKVLLLSLRDDFMSAKHTLEEIVKQQPKLKGHSIDDLLKTDQLEILYNWPGCITPAEFFHRIFVALTRQRNTDSEHRKGRKARTASTTEIVVLNGLEDLDTKFPLCGREKVFLPALLSLFRSCGVCSVIVCAEDSRSRGNQPNINSMADLILEFSYLPDGAGKPVRIPADAVQAVKVSAVRVPAGQIGGRWGALYREPSGRMCFHVEPLPGKPSRKVSRKSS